MNPWQIIYICTKNSTAFCNFSYNEFKDGLQSIYSDINTITAERSNHILFVGVTFTLSSNHISLRERKLVSDLWEMNDCHYFICKKQKWQSHPASRHNLFSVMSLIRWGKKMSCLSSGGGGKRCHLTADYKSVILNK